PAMNRKLGDGRFAGGASGVAGAFESGMFGEYGAGASPTTALCCRIPAHLFSVLEVVSAAPWTPAPTGIKSVTERWLGAGTVRPCLALERLLPAQGASFA